MNNLYLSKLVSAFRFIIPLLAVIPAQAQLPAGIFINEIMASNNSTITDPQGKYSDWIEIFNNTPSLVNLNGYFISDTPDNTQKFKLESSGSELIIQPFKHLILWATGEPQNGSKHLGFSLSASGEHVILTAPDGETQIHGFEFPAQRPDISYGVLAETGNPLRYFTTPTPGAANSTTNAYIGFLSPPTISHESGIYNANFSLSVSAEEGSQIYYSTDGSDPEKGNLSGRDFSYVNIYPAFPGNPVGPTLYMNYKSFAYSSPITITNVNNLPNKYSTINSIFLNGGHIPQNTPNDKVNTFRFRAEKQGYLPSEIVARTFIVNNRTYSLPIFSLQVNPVHMWDLHQGMYVAGYDFLHWRSGYPNENGYNGQYNFQRDQATIGNITFLGRNDITFDQLLQTKVQGGTSRFYPNKGLKFSTKDTPNSNIEVDFFESGKQELFHGFVLRNSGNDYQTLLFKDAAFHEISKNMNFEKERLNQSILFLNGEYWGITNLRDRINDNFLSIKYNINKDDIELGKNDVIENTSGDYEALISFVKSNDFSIQNNYEHLKSKIDISSFIDYTIAQSFFANEDALNSNYGYWRYKGANTTTNSPTDGKWRWHLYDLDNGFESNIGVYDIFYSWRSYNYFYKYIKNNTEFKTDFSNRYADLLNSVFLSEHVNSVFDSLATNISSEIDYHIARWQYPQSKSYWESRLRFYKTQIGNRNQNARKATISELGLNESFSLTVHSDSLHQGYVKVNSLNIKNGEPGIPQNPISWTGGYFKQNPIRIIAKAEEGYKFSHWTDQNNTIIHTDTITINTTSDQLSFKAFFELDILSENPYPLAFKIDSCKYVLDRWNSNEAAGSFPQSMRFIYYNTQDPLLTDTKIGGDTYGSYDYTSRTRMNGLNENGFSFINTGGPNENEGYPFGSLGGAILALNTENIDSLVINWTARTIVANPRKYAIRLMYREGDIQPFKDWSTPITYFGSNESNHYQDFKNILLPTELTNKPYIQLLWKYYYQGEGSGARDQLAIDDILIRAIKKTDTHYSSSSETIQNPSVLISSDMIQDSSVVKYLANEYIELLPGFTVDTESVFKAEIKSCD